jgi:tubulin-specific chaperone D
VRIGENCLLNLTLISAFIPFSIVLCEELECSKMVGLDVDMNRDDECDNIGLGCALEHFSEVEEVLHMIDNVKKIYNTSSLEVEYDKLYTILKQYYEQPHLLDPHLDKILTKFLDLIKDKNSPFELKHATFNYMYQIIRVRGYKVVVRHLPHEVSFILK